MTPLGSSVSKDRYAFPPGQRVSLTKWKLSWIPGWLWQRWTVLYGGCKGQPRGPWKELSSVWRSLGWPEAVLHEWAIRVSGGERTKCGLDLLFCWHSLLRTGALRKVFHHASLQSPGLSFFTFPSMELSTLKAYDRDSSDIHGARVPLIGRVWRFGSRGLYSSSTKEEWIGKLWGFLLLFPFFTH